MSIRSVFDRELEKLHLDMLRMGSLAQEAIDNAIIALKTRNEELAHSVIENDKEVDSIERAVEARALRLLLQQQPVARDLRTISTALKVITDMERIGDQAADIADISLRFSGQKFIKELIHIPIMSEIAIDMVKQSIDAYVRSDLEQARAVLLRDDEVDDLFESIKTDLVELISKDKNNADQAIDFLMIAKYLERIGDHATNIAEWVIFNITGEHKDEKIL